MFYKNTLTGVIIETPCKIEGANWIIVDNEEATGDTDPGTDTLENETEEEKTSPGLDNVTQAVGLDDVTKAEIMQELDSMGIKYDKKFNKQVLYDLMLKGI